MTVPFNTTPADARVPLFYGEVDNSMANSATTTLRRLFIAQVNDDQVIDSKLQILTRASDAAALGGTGSMLAAMYNRWRKTDPAGELWVVPVKLDTGVQATGTVTITGVATEAGLINLYVGATRVRAVVAVGQTANDTAAAVAAAVNASTVLPVTATVAAGVVTLKARWKGDTGNDIRLAINAKGAESNEKTPAGVAVALSNPSGGVGAPDLASVLALVGDEEFEFICHPYSDATSLDDLREWMNDTSGRWSFAQQLWGHVYTARRGTMGELVAAGRARNDQHMTIAGFEPTAPDPIWEKAAGYAARQAVFLSIDPARPTQTGEIVGDTPAPAGQRFVWQERQSLLSNGIATQTYSGGATRVERAITTYQKNAYGQADDSYLDSETMHTTGYVMRFLKSIITSKYGRHKLADDGTRFGAGDALVTPLSIRAELITAYQELERRGIVENSELFAKYLIVERAADNPNRLNVLFPPDYVNQLRVFALLNQFRLQYAETA